MDPGGDLCLAPAWDGLEALLAWCWWGRRCMGGFCAEEPLSLPTGCCARGYRPGSPLHTQSCSTCTLALNVAQNCPRSCQCQEMKMPSGLEAFPAHPQEGQCVLSH